MAVTTGDLAPPFRLSGTLNGIRGTYSLEELRGRPVVVVTYPGDNTPVCTRQLLTYSGDIAAFEDLDAVVLAVSPQDLDSHEQFAADHGGFAFPLLYDEDKSLARDYGVLGPMGFYRRCVFVVDAEGRLAFVHRGFAGATFRRTQELLAALSNSSATL